MTDIILPFRDAKTDGVDMVNEPGGQWRLDCRLEKAGVGAAAESEMTEKEGPEEQRPSLADPRESCDFFLDHIADIPIIPGTECCSQLSALSDMAKDDIDELPRQQTGVRG